MSCSRCWPDVVARVPGAQLVVAGLGNDVPRLQAKARALGVGHCVVFCGFLPRRAGGAVGPGRGLSRCRVRERVSVSCISRRCGLGRPCIGSTSDAAGDIIVHGETGLLVDRADGPALAEAIVSLLDGRRAAGGDGRGGPADGSEAEFTADRFAARL